MNIKIRRGHKEDLQEWDNFLIRSQMDHVLQSSVMGNVWNYISFKPVLVVAVESKDIVGGLMSHIWFGNNNFFPLYRPFSTYRSQYGPIVSNSNPKTRLLLLQKILEFVHEEVEAQRLMQHTLSTHYTWGDSVFRDLGYKTVPNGLRCTFIVNLQQSKESLWRSLDKDKRKGINKAEKEGVVIKEGINRETPRLFYNIHVKTANRLGILPDPYSFIEGIWKILVPNGYAKFLFAYFEDKLVAGSLFLIFNNKIYTYMSASLKEYHRVYPNNLLRWRMFEYGLENGIISCDLMGAPGPEQKNHSEYGLYIFKRGWGGKMVDINFFSKVFSFKCLWFWKWFNAAINRFPSFIDLINKKWG